MKYISLSYNNLEKSIKTKEKLKIELEKENFVVFEQIKNEADLIISIGGDGTFLKTAHEINFKNIPLIGLNTGHLGFFTEFEESEIDTLIEFIKSSEFFVQEINLIKANIYSNNQKTTIDAINEIVIKNIASRTVHLDISVDKRKIQSFSGDAILVSTPMGSTAYNYSAGGSIVDPRLDIIQLTPIAPMNTTAYRSFTSSIILPSKSMIDIVPEHRFEKSILVVSDGIEYNFDEIEKIDISKSQVKIKLLRMKNYDFFERACEKFL